MALKSLGEKSCEIKGGSQEMAAMVFIISINIIATTIPLILQLFHPNFTSFCSQSLGYWFVHMFNTDCDITHTLYKG